MTTTTATRICLECRQPFHPLGIGNWVCPQCKLLAERSQVFDAENLPPAPIPPPPERLPPSGVRPLIYAADDYLDGDCDARASSLRSAHSALAIIMVRAARIEAIDLPLLAETAALCQRAADFALADGALQAAKEWDAIADRLLLDVIGPVRRARV